MQTLHGALVSLRPATSHDVPALSKIRATPEVYRWWRGDGDLATAVEAELADADAQTLLMDLLAEELIG
jgi:aminoglycoside 6'-N-acetyltransferase